MSIRPLLPRTAVTTAGLVTAAVLGLAAPSVAAADPPSLNVDPCARLLQRAAEWPGEYSDGSRHVSDAFDSYLGRQPACSPGS